MQPWMRLLPEAVLSIGATLVLAVGPLGPQRAMRDFLRWLSIFILVLTATALFTTRGMLGLSPDGWSLVSPLTNAFSYTILALIALAVIAGIGPSDGAGEWFSLLLFVGLGGIILARVGNLGALFLGVEVLSIALYVLISFFYTRRSSLRAGAMYLALAGFASGFLLFGMALVYAAYGTIQIHELQMLVAAGPSRPLALTGFALFLVGIGFKLSLVPFHMWAADVYEASPATVGGVIASASKGGIVAAFLPFLFLLQTGHWWLVAVMSGASMVIGNLLGLRETRVKRILAYSSIAHIGYLMLGFLAAPFVVTGAMDVRGALLFYVLAYGLSVLGAFVTLSALRPEGAVTLNDLHGGARRHPLLAACMLIFVISLAGLPLSIGFWGKLYLFSAAFQAGYVKLALLGLLGSAIGLFYYLRILVHLFMVAPETGERGVPESTSLQRGVLVLAAAAVVVFGFFPDVLSRLMQF